MILDTNGNIFPEGTYRFRVSAVPFETATNGGYKGYQWSFETDTEEGPGTYDERFMVWLMASLMRALGFREVTPGKFDWEPTAALDRQIVATIVHEKIEKGPSAGKVVARMRDIKPMAPAQSSMQRAAVTVQAPAGSDEIPF